VFVPGRSLQLSLKFVGKQDPYPRVENLKDDLCSGWLAYMAAASVTKKISSLTCDTRSRYFKT
jgi:hypothetical protein